jgi:hypothetical protein
MAFDLEELRRAAQGQSYVEPAPRYREVSWNQHCDDHACTWDSFWSHVVLTVMACEALLWFLLKNNPRVVHKFFKLYDHKSFHSTEDLIFMTAAVGAAIGGLLFIDNIWKVFTNNRRLESLD